MWKKYGPVRQATGDNRRMRVACWIDKSTNTHSEFVIPIASALREWMHEHASILHLNLLIYVVPLVQQ
jgi:hypothetical protein